VGTVYRRFANEDALLDEFVRLALSEALAEVRQVLACWRDRCQYPPPDEGLEAGAVAPDTVTSCHSPP
jgi:AcrR family transcriptional regulator